MPVMHMTSAPRFARANALGDHRRKRASSAIGASKALFRSLNFNTVFSAAKTRRMRTSSSSVAERLRGLPGLHS
jgi:hypothetical protein